MTVVGETPSLDLLSLDEEGLRDYLTGLSVFDYAKQRGNIAKELGFRKADLDQFREGPEAEDTGQGSVIELFEPEVWDAPVDGAQVLSEASDAILTHMVMRKIDADACALWAAHTHIFDVFSHTPRLLVTAPDAECAKTLLMVHLVGDMTTRPLAFELMKPAPSFRLAELYKPTFLIDEADQFLHSDAEVLAAVNAGWEPHGKVPRCGGDDQEVRSYSTYCPVVLAGIEMHKHLKNTTISRSVVIHLERAGADELLNVETYDKILHRSHIMNIGRKFARWCADNHSILRQARPEMPVGIINRAADKWASLLAIADTAGGEWPERARTALQNQPDISEPSRAVQLLMDIYHIIGGEKGIWTKDLIPALVAIEEAPWADYNFKQYDIERKWITDRQISHLLKTYGVKHGTIRLGEGTAKGYYGEDIKTAYDRYRPKFAVTTSHYSNYAGSKENEQSQNVTEQNESVTNHDVDTYPETIENNSCDAVTDNLPPDGQENKNYLLLDEGWVDNNPDQVQ